MRLALCAALTLALAACSGTAPGPEVNRPQITDVAPPPTTGTVVVQPDQ
jgi:hypothetical protein